MNRTILVSMVAGLGILLCGNVQAMPEKICLNVSTAKASDKAYGRVRGQLARMVDGQSHNIREIFPNDYTTFREGERDCVDTKTLLEAFTSQGYEGDGYYFYNVKLDMWWAEDCHLSGRDAEHGWIAAPREGEVTFDFNFNFAGRSWCD